MEKLSKLKIAENLKLFYVISEIARTNVKKTYLEIYYELCDKSSLEEMNKKVESIYIRAVNKSGIKSEITF